MTAEIIPERIQIESSGRKLEGLVYTPLRPLGKQVLIVQGRNEMLYKYQDFCRQLCDNGIKVTVYDHIGQGFSPRITSDPEMCHIDSFDTYVNDLGNVIKSLTDAMPLTVIAISMGGLITLKAIQRTEILKSISRLIFISPFLGIRQPVPTFMIKALSHLRDLLSKPFSCNGPVFFYFNDRFRKKTIGLDANTHDSQRNDNYYNLYSRYPEAKLGGMTTSWLRSAVSCLESVWSAKYDMDIPSLFLVAENDNMVSSADILRFTEKLASYSRVKPNIIRIKNSLHDILIEEDQYRTPAVVAILNFIKLSD